MKAIILGLMYLVFLCILILFFMGAATGRKPVPPRDRKQ